MQLQIFEKSTGNLIAWLDLSNPQDIVIDKDYGVLQGDNLRVFDDGGDIKPMILHELEECVKKYETEKDSQAV